MRTSLSSVWVVARAAVRRRRGQTAMIGVIVMLCTATMLTGLALLAAVNGPFDRTFAQLNGAHATVMFDAEKVSSPQVSATAQAEGVAASAGPFPVAVAPLRMVEEPGFTDMMRVVGRADPGGAVNKLAVTYGRWPTGPNEMALSSDFRFGPDPAAGLGRGYRVPNVGTVTVVGIVYSVSQSGDAWMLPEAVDRIGITGYEMGYRFDPATAASAEKLDARTAAATGSLPVGAVAGVTYYLTLRERAGQNARTISSFLTVFAVLSLIVAILVISNVVSGAVIAGFRSIGVLKAVGFSPGQVTAVFLLTMVGPGVFGSAAGAVLGNLGARWMLGQFSGDYVLGLDTAPAPWLHAVAIGGILVLVALTALTPALRAGRQSATAALSTRLDQSGRGRSVQRRLSRSTLPRSVSLGLALPVVRPARSVLTLVAIVLGSATVVFATGLLTSAHRWNEALARKDHVQVAVFSPPEGESPRSPGGGKRPERAEVMTDRQAEAFLRGLPGARYVTVVRKTETAIAGTNENARLEGYRGDSDQLGYQVLSGRWFSGAGEAVVGQDILRLTGKAVGDSLTLYVGDKSVVVKLVGEIFSSERAILTDEATLPAATGEVDTAMYEYFIGLTDGVTAQEFIDRVDNAADTGLIALEPDDDDIGLLELIIVIGTLTTLLVVVAALGVAHTVVLNTRERRRDLAITKAVGMTPGQVVIMAITSVAVLGLLGGAIGLPGGIAAQRYVIQLIGESEETGLPQSILDVYRGMELGALLLCGVVIAVVGALLPARRAARVSTAEALHTE